jgi:hypothetical protein
MGRQLWALLHGLTTSELAGALGEPDEAEQHWRDAVLALLRGYVTRP